MAQRLQIKYRKKDDATGVKIKNANKPKKKKVRVRIVSKGTRGR
jgi:hypothetical protein